MTQGVLIGSAQILALLPHQRSASPWWPGSGAACRTKTPPLLFLLATPIILAAGVYKSRAVRASWSSIGGQVLAGSIASFVCAYLACASLPGISKRAPHTFAIYCALAGAGSLAWLTMR